jgi:FixJ family two-component response regulator
LFNIHKEKKEEQMDNVGKVIVWLDSNSPITKSVMREVEAAGYQVWPYVRVKNLLKNLKIPNSNIVAFLINEFEVTETIIEKIRQQTKSKAPIILLTINGITPSINWNWERMRKLGVKEEAIVRPISPMQLKIQLEKILAG